MDESAFEKWCSSVKDCGHEVQPNSATARQRKLGWDAAMAAKRESGSSFTLRKLIYDFHCSAKPMPGRDPDYNALLNRINEEIIKIDAALPADYCSMCGHAGGHTHTCDRYGIDDSTR